MPDRYDIIVVGAGPAGSLFSCLTARAGYQVLLLDKAFFPRRKVCGDCLNPRCWSIWKAAGLESKFRDLPHHRVAGFKISSEHRPSLEIPLETGRRDERAIARSVLDEWLRQEAMAAGATCLPSVNLRSFENHRDLVTSEGTFQADLFIGADGRNSWMARASGLATGKRKCSRIAWQATLPADRADDSVHMKFFREGYFGLVRFSSTEANLCMLLDSNSYDTPQMILDRFFDDLPPLGWKSTFPVSRSPNLAGRRNVLLLGDAARLVEPFTGEGIYLALHGAWDAAQLVIPYLAERQTGEGLGDLWRVEHRALFSRQLSFHNGLSKWLALKPHRGMFAVDLMHRFPSLLPQLVRSHVPDLIQVG